MDVDGYGGSRTVMNYAAEIGYPAAKTKIKKLPQSGHRRAQAWTSEKVARLFARRARSPLSSFVCSYFWSTLSTTHVSVEVRP